MEWRLEDGKKRMQKKGVLSKALFLICLFVVACAKGGDGFQASGSRGVVFSLKAPPGINYYAVEWKFDGNPGGEFHFTTPPDGEVHSYWFNLENARVSKKGPLRGKKSWTGVITDLCVRSPFADRELETNNLRPVKEKPSFPPDPVITSAIPSEAIPRAGRPFVVEAVVRNFGTLAAKHLRFTFDGLPPGVKSPDVATLSPIAPLPGANGGETLNNRDWAPQLPQERVYRFQMGDLGAGRHVFGLSVSADGVAPRRFEVVADVKPSLNLPRFDYPPEPKPVDTAPYTIGALMFPGWVSHKWHSVWSHEHSRKPVLGWYDEENPETVDWQIKYLVENGISFVSACWYWRDGAPCKNHWMKAFAKARYRKYLKWHMMWDNGLWRKGKNQDSIAESEKLFHYWCTNCFNDVQYHRIDGKPVVAVCAPGMLQIPGNKEYGVKKMLYVAREIAKTHGFPGIYFVAMRGMGKDLEDRWFLKLFADYGYDVTTVYGFRGGIPGSAEFDSRQRTYSSLAKLSLPHWRALKKNGVIPFWPSISTGYDDRPWRGEKVLEIRGYNVKDFAAICRDAKMFSDESGLRTFLLGPLDEWGEGSIGYPNHAHGFGIFEAVRETFGRKPADGWPVNYAPEDVGLVCPQRELAPASSGAKAAQSDAERMGSEMMNPGRGIGMSETAQGGDFKVLVYGNSIALHGPKLDIGWTNRWGMAASAPEKDFAHLVASGLEKRLGKKADLRIRNLASLERNFTRNLATVTNIAIDVAWAPDYVVIALGENSPNITATNAPAFRKFLADLARPFAKLPKRPKVVMRSPFWRNPAKADCTKKAAEDVGAIYVDPGHLGLNNENKAIGLFKHKGVANHPGDLGMKRLADLILAGFER